MSDFTGIGARILRKEDYRSLTGVGTFIDDCPNFQVKFERKFILFNDLRRFESQLAGAIKMQLKRTGRPAKAAAAFLLG